MTSVGATMVVAKVTHDEVAGKIKVEVISTGDSKAVIYHNGKKVLDSVIHTPANSDEMERLKQEDRMRPWDSVTTANNFEVLDDMTVCPKTGLYVSVQNYKWSITQSVGHIGFNGKEVLYEEGMLGISPYIAEMEFPDTDEINVKLFSDGVGDVINEEAIIQDKYVMTYLNATATANLAAARWKQKWRTCQKASWTDSAKRPMILLSEPNFCFTSNIPSKNQADDVSCVSWIQTCK
jgi:serine/threonine protein phosphatase PrpC